MEQKINRREDKRRQKKKCGELFPILCLCVPTLMEPDGADSPETGTLKHSRICDTAPDCHSQERANIQLMSACDFK